MYAIVEIAGKQYRVQKDDLLYIPLRKEEAQKKVTFDRVLLVSDGADVTVGAPVVEGAEVTATVVEHVKADKILVFRKKRRKRYRVKKGHRQPYTRIKVEDVSLTSGSKPKKAAKAKDDDVVAGSVTEAPDAPATDAKATAEAGTTSSKAKGTSGSKEAKTATAAKSKAAPKKKAATKKAVTTKKAAPKKAAAPKKKDTPKKDADSA